MALRDSDHTAESCSKVDILLTLQWLTHLYGKCRDAACMRPGQTRNSSRYRLPHVSKLRAIWMADQGLRPRHSGRQLTGERVRHRAV